jgi:hypothetical protein
MTRRPLIAPSQSEEAEASYVKKCEKVEGTKMVRRLQREAAHASNHTRHKKKFKSS